MTDHVIFAKPAEISRSLSAEQFAAVLQQLKAINRYFINDEDRRAVLDLIQHVTTIQHSGKAMAGTEADKLIRLGIDLQHGLAKPLSEATTVKSSTCSACKSTGANIHCLGCELNYHKACYGMGPIIAPSRDWMCVSCVVNRHLKDDARPRKPANPLVATVAAHQPGTMVYRIEGDDSGDNMDVCARCRDVGELLCCDFCERAFHLRCCVPQLRRLPDMHHQWKCHVCNGIPVNPDVLDRTPSPQIDESQSDSESDRQCDSSASDNGEGIGDEPAAVAAVNSSVQSSIQCGFCHTVFELEEPTANLPMEWFCGQCAEIRRIAAARASRHHHHQHNAQHVSKHKLHSETPKSAAHKRRRMVSDEAMSDTRAAALKQPSSSNGTTMSSSSVVGAVGVNLLNDLLNDIGKHCQMQRAVGLVPNRERTPPLEIIPEDQVHVVETLLQRIRDVRASLVWKDS